MIFSGNFRETIGAVREPIYAPRISFAEKFSNNTPPRNITPPIDRSPQKLPLGNNLNTVPTTTTGNLTQQGTIQYKI